MDKGEHLTDNAVFADVYVPDDPDAQDFARRFFLHASRRPTAFHAEVWDATRLLAETLVGLPADRLAIRDAFSRPRAYPGATGPLEVLASGQLRPRAHLLTIDGDLIRRRLSEDEERALRLSETPGGLAVTVGGDPFGAATTGGAVGAATTIADLGEAALIAAVVRACPTRPPPKARATTPP